VTLEFEPVKAFGFLRGGPKNTDYSLGTGKYLGPGGGFGTDVVPMELSCTGGIQSLLTTLRPNPDLSLDDAFGNYDRLKVDVFLRGNCRNFPVNEMPKFVRTQTYSINYVCCGIKPRFQCDTDQILTGISVSYGQVRTFKFTCAKVPENMQVIVDSEPSNIVGATSSLAWTQGTQCDISSGLVVGVIGGWKSWNTNLGPWTPTFQVYCGNVVRKSPVALTFDVEYSHSL